MQEEKSVESSGPDKLIGQTLGNKYKVVRLLGEGGMGAVYEGEQPLGSTKRKVAIKTLHGHLSRDPIVKERFEREVSTIAELSHPNTIQVYDFGSTADDLLYIVMEFLEGTSLGDLMEKNGALPPERSLGILRQICGSLEEAHGRGIVHRDLKPDNVVLVDRAGTKDFVKVLDFGIAKRSAEEDKNERRLTQQGTVLGTPPYMSPEQFTGRPIDARSDIYSLGVMSYEMIAGRLPFDADTAFEWASRHMNQAPLPLESLPEGKRAPEAMRAAIARALEKDPAKRFQKVREFGEALAGQGAAEAAPRSAVPVPSGRAKTEVGAPLDVAAAFAGQAMQGMQPSPPVAAPAPAPHPAATPAAGNMAMPTPPGIPQAPPRDKGRGGGRTGLLVAAGLIGVASVGAIFFAMRGSPSAPQDLTFDNGGSSGAPAATQPAAAASQPPAPAAPSPAPAPVPAGGGDLPALNGTPAGGMPAAGHPHAPPHPSGAPAASVPTTGGTPTAHPAPGGPAEPPATTAAPAQPRQPQAKYDGPECARARQLRALGHPKEAETWALACIAKGGSL